MKMFLPGHSKCVTNCTKCKEDIFEGQKYINFEGDIFCEECLSVMDAKEVFDMVGYYLQTAEL